MISVNAVSGGKSSSFMAYHYPTDINIFACVLTQDESTKIKDDSLREYCKNKLPNHDWNRYGSRELEETLSALRNLEQLLDSEIIWVSSELTFDELIDLKQAFPSRRMRFCTQFLKIKPIFDYLYLHHYNGNPFYQQVGFRYDENRNLNNCSKHKLPIYCHIKSKRQKWLEIDLIERTYPMIIDKVTHDTVKQWVQKKGLIFPEISNCDFCFFHTKNEAIIQALNYPDRANWWINQQKKIKKPNEKTINGCMCN